MSVVRIIQPKLHYMSGGLFGNWMPNNFIEVGDYGTLKNCKFERIGNIREFGADFDVVTTPSGKTNIEYKDKVEVSILALVEANAGPAGSGKVTLKMADRGAFLYHLANVTTLRPANARIFQEQVARALLDPGLELPKGVVLITEVQHAAKATIVVSDSSSCSVDLHTSFKPGGDAFLSGARGSVKVGPSRGSVLNFVGQDSMTTLLRLVRPVSPGPGPGGGESEAGMIERAIEWVKEQISNKGLKVSSMPFRYKDDALPLVTVMTSDPQVSFDIALADVSVAEMLATEDVAEDLSDEDGIEVEEVSYGLRSMEG